ncbi:exodeoxyribonuclease V subunit gamma [Rhodococcus sp. 06-235-1A]|uniref:exodeoxyribonuclease V subunit gamma n=1 Tax=Rhodococcus sp. 06-235-1A TaxID=2022508 RepID=UPI000B9A61FA|nr:exodeoxyribonuclease V subunit gamma [Rhodococcus sp. 06-235-1A]OZD02353.1 exodeoxyribonuclease V subunit gamma [Rhodococcus sp. 06-235-1A]
MLTLHRAERAGTLAAALADVLSVPLNDCFAAEIVSVPAKGVERWLTQRLSSTLGGAEGDGIAANIDFPSPARLVSRAIGSVDDVDPDDDPWAPGRVLWTALNAIDDCRTEPWAAVLFKHLGAGSEDHRVGRRWSTASHVAELFRAYGSQRPQMVRDWYAGRFTDGHGTDLDSDLLWQPRLWNMMRERIGSPSPAERLPEACARLRDAPESVDLPDRLSVFGATRLTTDQLDVLGALSEHRDVHIWVPHPSPVMWNALANIPAVTRRRDDATALAVEHPLLASLSRDVRELQATMGAVATHSVHHEAPRIANTLLGRIQSDIADDVSPSAAEESEVGVTSADGTAADDTVVDDIVADGTVQIHACHGPARQVEVLREALLHLFAGDPTLEPRDVLVMCPDVETYAPLIRANFGQAALVHPGHRLRVRLADRGLRRTNPVLDVIATVLDFSEGRVTASELLDFAASGPVREKFSFTDDELERLREWVTTSGARWGLTVRQREAFGLNNFRQNTFKSALDRILLGVAADETRNEFLDLALPLDDVDSNDITLAGRLAELVDRLASVLRALAGPATVTEWTRQLGRALDLLADVPTADEWQLAQAHREIADATEHGGSAELRLADVRAMLAGRLAGRPTRANFRTGDLTVCTMVPMRSVPHRVVVLLGLDDEVFPRVGSIDGDDILARDPALGERDIRSEDRQLLLDAVMSAEEKLLLFYTGADPVDGSVKPPAIPLRELMDVLEVTARRSVEHRHPLQPFDPRNFEAEQPFSFDTVALAGAVSQQRVPQAAPPFLPDALPPADRGDVELADVIAFVENPVQAFLRQRLGFRVPELEDDVADSLDIELDPLSRWNIGDRMLAAVLAGGDIGEFADAEWRRGTLPPFHQGRREMSDIRQIVGIIADAAAPFHEGPAETTDVSVDLGDGRRLTGTVTGIHGRTLARSSYSRLAPKHRLAAWVRLLAVAASQPGEWSAVTIGRASGMRPPRRSRLTVPRDPVATLRQLVDLRDRGLASPLPISTGTASAYAEKRFGGGSIEDGYESAGWAWRGDFGDGNDRSLRYVHGPTLSFQTLIVAPPLSDETEPSNETSRFGILARTLWDPLLSAENRGNA